MLLFLPVALPSLAIAAAPVRAIDGPTADEPAFARRPLTIPAGPEARDLPVRTLCGSPDKNYIIEVNGGGLALGDFDGSGSLDLVVVDGSTLERVEAGQAGNAPRLFLNSGAGEFTPAGEAWGMSGGQWGMGCATGDVDGDGHLDLMITEWGPDRLFRNADGEGFTEITETAGFKGGAWGTSAAFLDYDRDGNLDLAVVNYLSFRTEGPDGIKSRESGACKWKGLPVMCGPEGLIPMHDRLYKGAGDGTFEDVSLAAGYRPAEAGFGLGIVTVDLEGDGDTDLYVTNDSTPNHLWINQGDGTFEERGMAFGVALDDNGKEQAGMGIAVGDVSGDGRPDLFATNFSGENNSLYRSRFKRGRLSFDENSRRMGLGGPSTTDLGWGTGFIDVDHDRDLDVFVFNGHVYPQADTAGTDTSYAQPARLYRQIDGERFEVEELAADATLVQRAAAHGDLDGDGDLDLVALEMDGAVQLYENRGGAGAWLIVELAGEDSNSFGLGAQVSVEFEGGSLASEMRTAGGYQAALPPELHFGLGDLERVTVEVRWPSGRVQRVENVAPNRRLRLDESEAPAKPVEGQENE
jgi:hypothetical protein